MRPDGRPLGAAEGVPAADDPQAPDLRLAGALSRAGWPSPPSKGRVRGEFWPNMKMRPDYHRAVSAVAEAVGAMPDVDAGRMMLLGKSFGGFLAPQAAAEDGRCVAYFAMVYILTRGLAEQARAASRYPPDLHRHDSVGPLRKG